MDSVPKYLGVGLVAITIIYFLIALINRHPQPKFRRVIGLLFIVYGIYLATITKTSTHFVLPFSSVAQGAGGGAVAGLLTGLIVGTVGVVTGGVGVAVGALAMTLGGAILGGIGGTAAGFGWKTHTSHRTGSFGKRYSSIFCGYGKKSPAPPEIVKMPKCRAPK